MNEDRFTYNPDPDAPDDQHLKPGMKFVWGMEYRTGESSQPMAKLRADLGHVPSELIQNIDHGNGTSTMFVMLVAGETRKRKRAGVMVLVW